MQTFCSWIARTKQISKSSIIQTDEGSNHDKPIRVFSRCFLCFHDAFPQFHGAFSLFYVSTLNVTVSWRQDTMFRFAWRDSHAEAANLMVTWTDQVGASISQSSLLLWRFSPESDTARSSTHWSSITTYTASWNIEKICQPVWAVDCVPRWQCLKTNMRHATILET